MKAVLVLLLIRTDLSTLDYLECLFLAMKTNNKKQTSNTYGVDTMSSREKPRDKLLY